MKMYNEDDDDEDGNVNGLCSREMVNVRMPAKIARDQATRGKAQNLNDRNNRVIKFHDL